MKNQILTIRKPAGVDRRGSATLFYFLWLFTILYPLCFSAAEAVQPKIWQQNSQATFESGEGQEVSLTREGTVTLSPGLQVVADTEAAFVWSLVEGSQGDLYVGTGNQGQIYQVKAGTDAKLIFDSPDVAIFSLTVGSDGALYAGSSPDGVIYRKLPGKDAEVFCQTGDEHVWALSPRPGGGLYAATGGGAGRVLSISSKGEVRVVYESKDPNIVSLAVGSDGTIYAGTDENGLIYRIQGKSVDVLYDAGEKEIHSLAVGPGNMLYAGAMSGRADNKGGKDQGQNGKKEASVVYAIRHSGSALKMWEVEAPTLLGLSVKKEGGLTVLVGNPGRIYRVWKDGTATLLVQMEEVHPWVLAVSKQGGFWIGSSGGGTVYRLGKDFVREGTLISEPHDFSLVSKWGKVAWRAETPTGTSVAIQTRSGNSAKPDDTWSDWSADLTDASGSAIVSRPARFLQYRVRLKSKTGRSTPRLRAVTISGLQENVPPQILAIHTEPEEAGKNGKESKNGKGTWKISWEAADVNDDRLHYDLYFKGQNETGWKLLQEKLTPSDYVWHTESVPDGTMQVRVVASDGLSNPDPLSVEKISSPFDVDNTAPLVEIRAVKQTGAGRVLVEGRVVDLTSAVREAAYAVNSEPWQVVFPTDEIFDSPTEALKFTIASLKPGEYTLVVRAKDMLGNIGVGKSIFVVK